MNILLVEDEPLSLDILKGCVEDATNNANIAAFDNAKDAHRYAKDNKIDVAFLDIHLPDGSGVDLAKKLNKITPTTNVVFVTSDDSFKADAMDLKVSGYLSKPISTKKIVKELAELRHPVPNSNILLRVQCFGNFAVFKPNGEIIKFSRTKSQEMFAYLVSKRGTGVSVKELGAILFEDREYDEKQQHYLQQLFYSLSKDLKDAGAEEVLIRNYNSSSINANLIDCDYYRFCDNDKEAKKLYTGEFMMQYEWADYITGYLDRTLYED